MARAKVVGVVAALAVAACATAAWAGGCCRTGGFGCQNQCPLAQQASQCRAYGNECAATEQAIARQVMKNLEKI